MRLVWSQERHQLSETRVFCVHRTYRKHGGPRIEAVVTIRPLYSWLSNIRNVRITQLLYQQLNL